MTVALAVVRHSARSRTSVIPSHAVGFPGAADSTRSMEHNPLCMAGNHTRVGAGAGNSRVAVGQLEQLAAIGT
jgi:precorrin isomerase